MLFCRAVGSMGQRKSGAPGAAAPISTEEEQLKFQDSRFLATLVLGRSRWVTEHDWLTGCLPRPTRRLTTTDVATSEIVRHVIGLRDPHRNPGIRLHTDYCCVQISRVQISSDRSRREIIERSSRAPRVPVFWEWFLFWPLPKPIVYFCRTPPKSVSKTPVYVCKHWMFAEVWTSDDPTLRVNSRSYRCVSNYDVANKI